MAEQLTRQFAEDALRLVEDCEPLSFHNLLELLAVRLGFKRVMRLVLSDEVYRPVSEFCENNNLAQRHSLKKQAPQFITPTGDIFTTSVDWNDPAGRDFVVIIARSESEVTPALVCENRGVSFREFGDLYEYPCCCVEVYGDLKGGEDWIEAYLRRSTAAAAGYYQGNRLAALFDGSTLIPDYFPCRTDCEATKALGTQYAAILRDVGWNDSLMAVERSLLSPILIRSGALIQLRDSNREGDKVKYDASKALQINWKQSLPTDDPFWQADLLELRDGVLKMMASGRVVLEEAANQFENHLLLFR